MRFDEARQSDAIFTKWNIVFATKQKIIYLNICFSLQRDDDYEDVHGFLRDQSSMQSIYIVITINVLKYGISVGKMATLCRDNRIRHIEYNRYDISCAINFITKIFCAHSSHPCNLTLGFIHSSSSSLYQVFCCNYYVMWKNIKSFKHGKQSHRCANAIHIEFIWMVSVWIGGEHCWLTWRVAFIWSLLW